VVQQRVLHFFSDGVPFRDGQVRGHSDIQFRVQAMA
jgi:hypothetical protein